MVTVVATVGKGCGSFVSAQMGQRVVFAWLGVGSCSRGEDNEEKNQSMIRLMELLQKKRAPADQDLMK